MESKLSSVGTKGRSSLKERKSSEEIAESKMTYFKKKIKKP